MGEKLDFVIGTGYHRKGEWEDRFKPIWGANTRTYYSGPIYCIGTVAEGIPLYNNLGHVGDLLANNKSGLCGWSHAVISCAVIAYGTGKDLIWKEQDCLWFGPVPEQMYADAEGKQMIFGGKMQSPPYMPCAQATFLIRHKFLLEFVRQYLSLPDDKDMLPESKFATLAEQQPENYGFLSFGVDRQRPIPWDARCWYAQHWRQEELDEAKSRGLI